MLAKRTINAPDWLEENELLSLLLSHATTKYENFASRTRAFVAKHGCEFIVFKKRVEETDQESFAEWDDLIAWEAFEQASLEWQTRCEELQACLT